MVTILFVLFASGVVFSQDTPPSGEVGNYNALDIDLTYSVESDTIAAGVAVGNASVWGMSQQELDELGLTSSVLDARMAEQLQGMKDHDTGEFKPEYDAKNALPKREGVQWSQGKELVGYDDTSRRSEVGWYTNLGSVYNQVQSGTLGEGVSRELGDTGYNVDAEHNLQLLGLDDLDSVGATDTAPAIVGHSEGVFSAVSQNEWTTLFRSLDGDVGFVATDFIPRFEVSRSGTGIGQKCREFWNGMANGLDDWLLDARSAINKIRGICILAYMLLLGRKILIFLIRTGPIIQNAIVNVLTNSWHDMQDAAKESEMD